MKRTLLIWMVLFLCLCGCAAPAKTQPTTAVPTEPAAQRILGTWYTHVDCADLCNQQMQALLGPELAPYFDFTGINVLLQLDLDEDGNFSVTITQEAIDHYTGAITQTTQESLRAYLEQTMAQELNGESLNAYMVRKQLTMEQLLVAAGIDMSQLIYDMVVPLRDIPCTGTYYVHDRLHIAGAVCGYTLTDSTLSLKEAEGESLAAFPALFPLDFFRQELPPLGYIPE